MPMHYQSRSSKFAALAFAGLQQTEVLRAIGTSHRPVIITIAHGPGDIYRASSEELPDLAVDGASLDEASAKAVDVAEQLLELDSCVHGKCCRKLILLNVDTS